MLPVPAQTPPPLPPVRTDARLEIEPDEQWKDDLAKRIEHGLRNMVEEAQIVRDTILSSQPPESNRERALQDYENSMAAIRKLAQEEFTRQLRLEMSERKWALNVIDSNSPDVARQQQLILDNIQKAQDERIFNVSDDPSHNTAGALSSSPQQQGDGEGGSDESFEDGSEGYGDAGSDDDESRASEEDDDEDEGDEEGSKPRQSRLPSRPDHPLTQSHPSKSPVARRDVPSRQRQSSNNQPPEDNEEEDADGSYGHPPRWDGSQPYVTGAAPRRPSSGSRAPSWRPHPRPPEPSGISRTLAHANGQIYTGPVPFPRRGSVNSTGSTSSGAGLHRAGSLTSEQFRGSSIPHTPNTAERPLTQSRDRIVANISPRERQTSASASPHDRPSPPSHSIVSPRAIPGARPPSLDESMRFPMSASPSSRAIYGPQRSPEDMRQGIAIPRGPTSPDEGQRVASWGSSLHSRRSVGDFNTHRRQSSKGDSRLPPVNGDDTDESDDVVGRLDDRQSLHSARSLRSVRSMRSVDFEQMVMWREAEVRRKEEEATRKEEEANKKEEEARRLEEKARQSMNDATRLGAEARQAEASAKMREAAAQTKEAEAKRKEAEAKKREAEAQKREAEAQRKEEVARHRELEARRKEEQARRKEEEAQRKEEEAKRREEEFRRKEDDARKREEDAKRREEDARQLEIAARKKEDDARRFEEEVRRKEREARRKEEEAWRAEVDYERKKREIDQKEAELKKREAELLRKEEAARQVEEKVRLATEEATRQDDEAANADEANRVAEELARQAIETESSAAEQERPTKGQGRKGSKGQTKRQKALEERRQKELEQQQCLEEQRRLEEQQRLEEERKREEERLRREREEQIRLDEELSRQEQERLDREVLLEEERRHLEAQEREANRLREEHQRAVEVERLDHLEEQRRKAAEQIRQRDEQHRQQQQEGFRQRTKEEQEREFQRREALYYQRTLERERQNSIGASDSWAAHRPTPSVGSTSDRSSASSIFSSSNGSTLSSRPTSMASPHTTSSSFPPSPSPFSSTARSSPTTARPGAPGTSPHATKFDEAEWARRAEERARQQQEQFRREQERLESEQQAKSVKMLSREDLIRLFESHESKWRQLKDGDKDLGWNSFAWPVFKRPSEPEEMTTSAIGAYVLSRYAPDASSKNSKDRIKDHIKRWHPDKFETRILPRVAEEERERVKAGAGAVVRGLNELLRKNYDD